MVDSFGLLGLLLLLFSGNGGRGASSTPPRRPAPRPPPMLPPGGGLVSTWPSQPATGLPAFPKGWEYDEPPPAAVKQRAAELVPTLVKKGIGARQTEQTAGRWITYRVEKMRSGKTGITAWRLKATTTAPAPQPRATSSPASPASPAAYNPGLTLPGYVLTATSAGMPVAAGDRVAQIVAGRWYQWTVIIDTADPSVTAEAIAKGISLGGGVDVVVSRDRPFLALYVQQAKASGVVPLNKPLTVDFAGFKGTITFLEAKEVKPKPPAALPPGVVSTTAPSSPAVPVSTTTSAPRTLPMLKRGAGIKPQAPSADVRLLQSKLGIPADGQFGAGTEASVKAYQKSRGLTADGIVGAQTWSSLFAVRA